MSTFTSGNVPGFRSKRESEEKEIAWSGRGGQDLAATKKVVLKSSSVDAGNSPTTTLRGGLIIGIKDSDGCAYPYDPDATDGTQVAIGILEHHQDMLVDGVATDRFTQILVQGLVRESQLIGLDPMAKAQLGGRFLFDSDLSAATPGMLLPRGVARKAGSYTVTASDNGLLFVAAAAASFTLPAKQNGLRFRFLQTADASLVITGSSDLITINSSTASQLTFNTANQRIGTQVLVECIYTAASTLRWLVTNLGGTTVSVS